MKNPFSHDSVKVEVKKMTGKEAADQVMEFLNGLQGDFKPEQHDEFYPHLESTTMRREWLGKLGEPSAFVDCEGETLCVGDIVSIVGRTESLDGPRMIAFTVVGNVGEWFGPLGIANSDCTAIDPGYVVTRLVPFNEFSDGERAHLTGKNFRYVLKDHRGEQDE